jgi:hypothetical protein
VSGQTDGPGSTTGPEGVEPVGTVAEEAAKLLGAFSGWAKEHGDGLSAFTDGLHEQTATSSPECAWCPVCRTVAAVRQTSPEVVGHLTSAASSLMLAVSGMMATAPPDREEGGVERIPLDEDWPEGDA